MHNGLIQRNDVESALSCMHFNLVIYKLIKFNFSFMCKILFQSTYIHPFGRKHMYICIQHKVYELRVCAYFVLSLCMSSQRQDDRISPRASHKAKTTTKNLQQHT